MSCVSKRYLPSWPSANLLSASNTLVYPLHRQLASMTSSTLHSPIRTVSQRPTFYDTARLSGRVWAHPRADLSRACEEEEEVISDLDRHYREELLAVCGRDLWDSVVAVSVEEGMRSDQTIRMQ